MHITEPGLQKEYQPCLELLKSAFLRPEKISRPIEKTLSFSVVTELNRREQSDWFRAIPLSVVDNEVQRCRL